MARPRRRARDRRPSSDCRRVREMLLTGHDFSFLNPELGDVLEDTQIAPPDAGVLVEDQARQVQRALATLSEPQRQVLRLRFGLDDGEHTLEEIGHRFGLTRERIRQIEAKALRKLRPTLADTRSGRPSGESRQR